MPKFHYEILTMERQLPNSDMNNEEQEVKPIVFPEGSIDLHHSEITLTTCSLFISIKIHHQDGFFYEVYFRDSQVFSHSSYLGKYKVIQSKIIESYDCTVDKDNEIIVIIHFQIYF